MWSQYVSNCTHFGIISVYFFIFTFDLLILLHFFLTTGLFNASYLLIMHVITAALVLLWIWLLHDIILFHYFHLLITFFFLNLSSFLFPHWFSVSIFSKLSVPAITGNLDVTALRYYIKCIILIAHYTSAILWLQQDKNLLHDLPHWHSPLDFSLWEINIEFRA